MKSTYSYLLVILSIASINMVAAQDAMIQSNSDKPLFRKGSAHVALTANANASNDTDIENLLISIDNRDATRFNFEVLGGYFIKDNFSVGGAFGYSYNTLDMEYSLDDTNYTHLQRAKNEINITGFIRNYYPFGKKSNFAFFNETDLTFGFGAEVDRSTKSADIITKEYSDNFTARLGVRPGISIVLIKGFAFETSLDLLGFEYKNKNVKKDENLSGTSNDYSFDFEINLLSLNFGLAYYF